MLRHSWMGTFLILAGGLSTASAGWPFFADDGPRRGSQEWYELHAGDPPGTRQRYHHGKLWPPFPRPTGPHQSFVHKFHASHYWPYPYVCDDRASVRAYADIQSINGWATATTLFDYHFDPLTQELTPSGRAHLQWIMLHAPEQFRQAHVAMTQDQMTTNLRVANVERAAASMIGSDRPLLVLATASESVGRPASEVHHIFVSAQQNALPPVISYTGNSSGSSGGSGSPSGGSN